jgi:hypothetical protein
MPPLGKTGGPLGGLGFEAGGAVRALSSSGPVLATSSVRPTRAHT